MTGFDPLISGHNMPMIAPLYPDPPYHYRDARMIFARYEADSTRVEPLLPEDLKPRQNPVQCVAVAGDFAASSFGKYREAFILVDVEWDGAPYLYQTLIYCNLDVPIAAGRELWGFPKKLASIDFDYGDDGIGDQLLVAVDRPSRKRLMTINMTLDRPAAEDALAILPRLALRKIPNSEADRPPSICELIRIDSDRVFRRTADGSPDLWSGRCSVTMDSASVLDPLDAFSPTRMLGAYVARLDFVLPLGKKVKDYLA